MRNILLAMGVGVLVFAALFVPGLLHVGEAMVPAALAVIVAYFLLARRTFKQVEAVFTEAAKSLTSMPPKLDLAVATMEKAYVYAPQQIGVKSQIDAQIGVIYFLQQEFNKATPYLQRSLGFGHWMAGAMLAVVYYKRKDHEQMKKTLEIVTKRAKDQALAWALHGYLLCQIGDRDGAQKVLAEGVKKTKDDERVKEALLAVQNDKKIKMKAFKEQWYQFHLERPPMDYQQIQMGGRVSKAARRGRWS